MNKKYFYYVIIFALFIELFFQLIPVIYRNLSVSQKEVPIYVLGHCVSYGYPYQGKVSFPKTIARMLNNKIDDKDIKIVMLSEASQTIFQQYLKYYKYKLFHPHSRGIVLCYMSKDINNLQNITTGNNKFFINILKRINLINLPTIYFNKINDFKSQYDIFLYLINKFGDDIYVSTVSGNYSGAMPNNIDSLIKNKNLKEELQIVDNLILNNNYDYALEKINELFKIYKNDSQILYRVGKIYEKQQKINEANSTYKKMIKYEDLRPTIEENMTIRNLAKKYNVTLVDIDTDICNKNKIIGYNYFIDMAHPTIDFDIFIAQEFIEKIKQNYKIDIIDTDITKQLEDELSYIDWFIVYRDALGEIFYYSYYKKAIFDVYNKEIISNYISKLYEFHNKIEDKNITDLNKREEIIHICEILFEYIQGNKEKTIKLINDYNLKDIILQREKKDEERMQCWWYMKHWLIDFIFENKI